ncbi:MAG: putative peptidoglycan-binding domain-containing protein [Bacteroidales bacterium]|nr:putative peptidoglycan-binding domain-containing protein [Bacteroidales bacterium]
MAKIEALIPFLIYFESGVADSSLDAKSLFEKAKGKGIACDPSDAGGATLAGITIGTYRDYCRKKGLKTPGVADLARLQYAEWLEILKTMFWDRWQADRIESQPVAEMLVDWVWTSGRYGITIPQRLLGVTADGIVGPATLAALAAREPAQLFGQIKAARIDYIESICRNRPANLRFRKGWLRRIAAINF